MTIRDLEIAEHAKARLCFLDAIALYKEQREEYLAKLHAENPEIATIVEELIEECENPSGLLDRRPEAIGDGGWDLKPGDVVGRFGIISRLGRGGMGNVYEAVDRELGEHVALKTILPELLLDSRIRKRFKHEILNGKKVAHENVCRIHDLVDPRGENDSRLAFTMELLNGETLAARLDREKKLAPEEALPLARQMAKSLRALHRCSIIHRDFKPGNIFITETEAGDPRVKITDFGLARHQPAGEDPKGSIDTSGAIPGTPAYMAPEQLRGERSKIGPATDVYALGLVLYEMVTGQQPFPANTIADNAIRKAQETPAPPSKFSPGLDKKWDRTILACLAVEPKDRPQTPGAVLEMLEGRVEPPARPKSVPRRLWAAAAAALVIFLGLFLTKGRLWLVEDIDLRVAVLPFKPLGGDPEFQAFVDGLTVTVTRQISRFEGLNEELLVTAPSIVRSRGVTDPEDAGNKLGVNYAVVGELQAQGDRVRAVLGLVEVESGRQFGAVVEGTRDDALGLEDKIVARIATLLDLQIQPQQVDEDADLIAPGAHEFYTAALGNLQRSDQTESINTAISLLERAIREGGESALYYAALCDANWTLYERTSASEWVDRAREACEKAEDLDDGLPEVQVTLGRLHAGTGDYEEALANYQSARDLSPRNADAFLGLAQVYALDGDATRAEATYRDALRLRKGDWRIYRHLCRFRFSQGEFERAVEPCQRVVELTPNSAQAHQNLGAALAVAGRMAEARHEFERAVEIEPSPVALKNLAKTYLDTGDHATAAKYYEQARDKSQSDYRVWMDLAGAYDALGDSRAGDAYAKAASLAQQRLDVNPELHDLWSVIAHCWAGAAERSEALVWLERATERIDQSAGIERTRNAATYAKLADRTECLRWVKLALESADGRTAVASSRWLQEFLGPNGVRDLIDASWLLE